MIERPKEPKPFDEVDDELGDPFPEEDPTSSGKVRSQTETPTIAPPFDFDEFAKTSDSKLRAASPSGAATQPPPTSAALIDLELELELPGLPRAPPVVSPRPRQITLVDPDELETARLRSVLMPSEPPPAMPDADEERPTSPAVHLTLDDFDAEPDPFGAATLHAVAKPALDPLAEMYDRFSLGDYTGALEVAEAVLRVEPANAEALDYAKRSRDTLQSMYTARIGPLDRVPVVMVPREQLRWLSIDHRAGFLLSHVDGVSSLEMILDVSGMPTLDALRILYELAQQRVISFR